MSGAPAGDAVDAADPIETLARQLADGPWPALPAAAAGVDPLALAWALKHQCQAAWTREPARARHGAAALAQLAAAVPAAEAVHALRDWTAGIAALTEGRMADALAGFDAAGAAFAALGDPQHAAETEVPKLVALSMLGRHDDALRAGETARRQFLQAGALAAAGKVELNLGSMLLRQDRYEDAARHYRSAARRFAGIGDREHSVMADIGLATVLTWQFDFDEASRMYARAAQRAEAHGLQALQGVIAASRGRLELHRGRHADALRWLVAALAAFEAEGNPQRLAEARRDLADAYLALQLLPEAQALYDSAIERCRSVGAPTEQAWATVQRAQALAGQGALDAAARDLADAAAAFAAQGNAVGAGLVALHGAGLQRRRGDPLAALRQADDAAAAFAAAGIHGWRLEALAAGAEALADAGRDDEAAARFATTRDEGHGLPEIDARCSTGLGRLQRRRGDVDGARANWQRAVEVVARQQAGLHGDEFSAAYGAGRLDAHEALVALALDDGDAAALLQAMEQARAQALALGLRRAGAAAEGDGPQAWRWLHEQWRQAVADGQAALAASLQARVREAEADWLEQHRRREAGAGAAGARSASPPAAPPTAALDIAALQAALPSRGALLAYMQLGNRLAACVVTRDALHARRLDAEALDTRITRLRDQIDALRFGAARLQGHAEQLAQRVRVHLQRLHAQLWAPLQPLLDGCEQVVVLPHRGLHYVPFAALHDGQRHLVERHAFSHAPSARLWLAAAARPPRPLRRLLALGVGGPALPQVAAELQAVAAAFGDGARTRLDADATHAALRAGLADADVLHLACHGQFRADSPYFSSLQLADGPLTLRDAAALPLQAGLVTLSACETGLSRVAPGDELLGLVRGFLLAGAPRVLATLWTVDDAGCAALMADFYQALRGGADAATALQRAQQRRLAAQPHPWFWAPFVLHGPG